VISAIKNPAWPGWAKRALAVGVSAIFGLLALWFRVSVSGVDWSPTAVVGYVILALLVSQLVYKVLLSGVVPGLGALADVNRYLEGLGNKSAALDARLAGSARPIATNGPTTNGEATPGSRPGG
jgi:hypothetical protein